MATEVDRTELGVDLSSNRARTRAQNTRRFKWSVLAPLILIFALVLMPVLFVQLYFSFNAYSIYLGNWWQAEWVGFEIFQDVLTDPRLGWAIIRSLSFALGSTLGCFVFGFGLALLMYRPFKGQGLYYIFFILPMLTVPIVIAYTGEMLLYQKGPINGIISAVIGTDFNVLWLTNANLALITVMIMEIWNWTPFTFIVLVAGLSSLPTQPQEAAQILGASRWKIFWEVQLPLLRPVIMLALILRFLEAMAEFPKTWALFQGGPGSATETIPVYIYLTTWQYFDISKGAAMSYVVLVLMVFIVLLAIRILQREKRSLDSMYATQGGD